MEINLSITQQNIDKGVSRDCAACPAALGLLEHPQIKSAMVGKTSMSIFLKDNKVLSCRTPRDLSNFINHFDLKLPVQPISIPKLVFKRIMS